jgi:hypothetical protein
MGPQIKKKTYWHMFCFLRQPIILKGFLSREEWPIKLPTKPHGKKALGFCFAILHSSHPLLQCFLSLKNDPLRMEDDRRLSIIGLISTFKVSSHGTLLFNPNRSWATFVFFDEAFYQTPSSHYYYFFISFMKVWNFIIIINGQ